MLQTTNAFTNLHAQFIGLVTERSQIVDPNQLLTNLVQVAKTMSTVKQPKRTGRTPQDPEEVWRLWKAAAFNPEYPERLQWNTLCLSPLTALRPELVHCLEDNPEPLARLSNFLGIAYAYINKWRPSGPTTALPERIEGLLWAELNKSHLSTRNRVLLQWQTSHFLFTPEASNRLAEQALKLRTSVCVAAEALFLEPTSQLVLRSIESAAERETENLLRSGASVTQPSFMERWRWNRSNIFVSTLTPETYRRCMSMIIASDLTSRFPAFRQELVQEITDDARLGDPRLAESSPNWRSVAEQPRQVFLSWLAERYIQLFFDILVPKTDENRRRAEFWLHYAKRSGNIKDFQVAVSNDDMRKVDRSRDAQGLSFARVEAASTASSAFLMEFHGHGEQFIIVEFSETGNAASIYRRSVFEGQGVSFRRGIFSMGQLKNTSIRLDSIPHVGDWVNRAVRKLSGMGIVP